MKTQYKYIHFEELPNHDWICVNTKSKDWLGEVEYYSRWRSKWVFSPDLGAIFDSSCLDDISHFMKQLPVKGGKG